MQTNGIETLKVEDIQIGNRHRQDQGNIAELAKSIRDVGLLHPIVITPAKRLVAGGRRLAAVKELGWTDVPVRIVNGLDDALALLRAERDENQCRKEFTPSEAVAVAEALTALEKPKARIRQKATQFKGKKQESQPDIGDGTFPSPNEEIGSGKLPEPMEDAGQTRDKVAEAVGMSGRTLEKAKEVVQAAEENPEQFGAIKEEMDRTGKVDPAHKQVQKHKPKRSSSSAKKPKKCNIKGLVKPIKTLVEDGQLSERLAKQFAVKVDMEAQEQLIAGKDGAALVAMVTDWSIEQDCIQKVARVGRMIPLMLRSGQDETWHFGRATSQGRKTILEHMFQVRSDLDEILTAVTKVQEANP